MYGNFIKTVTALTVIVLLTLNSQLPMGNGMGDGYHTKEEIIYEYHTEEYEMAKTTSGARIIREKTLVRQKLPGMTEGDYEVLCRIVQAEAGGEDMLGKQMVADVIINRVESSKFPNTVRGVVFQGTQFSPVKDGRYYSVKVSKETKEAVEKALVGADSTDGALYFVNAQKADTGKYSWFENSLSFCAEHGGHRFYK